MTETTVATDPLAQEVMAGITPLREEVRRVIVGQETVINHLIIALLTGGHVLVEGVPGIAKTLIIRSLSRCIDCSFVRLQFTPDLLPADIVGTRIFNQKTSSFSTEKGPIFHNFILADEINRAPPKVQSALLEAMQEGQVTIQGETYPLHKPFFVLATENPIESEGTYPLPEAQVDRFMFKVLIGYPTREEEVAIIRRYTAGEVLSPRPVLGADTILRMQDMVRKVRAESRIHEYVAGIVDATRNPSLYNINLGQYIAWGASPRASIALVLGAKAHALLSGRDFVIPEDVKAIAHPVLRHRILLNYEGEAAAVQPDQIVNEILGTVRVP